MDSLDTDWLDRRVMLVMAALLDEARPIIDANLAGLTDAEYFWEPAPGCWRVCRRHDVVAPHHWGAGEWVVETSFDGATQPSMTTIGWRLMHAYDCTNDFTSRAFGRGGIDWDTIEVPGQAAGAVALMLGALDRLDAALRECSDDVLVDGIDADFAMPRWRLLAKAFLEAIHHLAEVGVLRQAFALVGDPQDLQGRRTNVHPGP